MTSPPPRRPIAAHPITVTVSTGRCGTTYLAETFELSFPDATIAHESLHPNVAKPAVYHRAYDARAFEPMLAEPGVRAVLNDWRDASERAPVFEAGWTMSALVPGLRQEYGDQLRALIVHRHPVQVAASFAVMGHYSLNKSPAWAITPFHDRVLYPQFADRWDGMSPFERSLYRWLEITAYGLELPKRFPDLSTLTVTADEIFRSPETLDRIAEFAGLPARKEIPQSPRKNVFRQNDVEVRPIGDEWERYDRHPEVVSLGRELGYDMSRDHLRDIVRKYQMPPGVLPWLRRASGYWALRRRGGAVLRSLGLRGGSAESSHPRSGPITHAPHAGAVE
ncbi:hypothetical protein [Alienimonas sp. DA493]|uniref:hypothetical protein n=1 Tax=Alienimonas sp. DA493 TaxID=3373605 RepID=UPI0037542365